MRTYISGSSTTISTTISTTLANVTHLQSTTPHSLLASQSRLSSGPIVGAGVVVVVMVVAVAGGIWWLIRVKRMTKLSAHEDELSTPEVC